MGPGVGAGAGGFGRIVGATAVDPPASPCGACRQLLAEFGLDLEVIAVGPRTRSEEHTSELQSPCISYAVFCLKKKKNVFDRRNPHGIRSRLEPTRIIVTTRSCVCVSRT